MIDSRRYGHRSTYPKLALAVAGALLAVMNGCGSSSDPVQRTASATATPTGTPTFAPTSTATSTPPATATATPSPGNTPTPTPRTAFLFLKPAGQQLSLAGPIDVVLMLPSNASAGSLFATLDGTEVTSTLSIASDEARGRLSVSEGQHRLVAVVRVGDNARHTEVFFETVALQNPDECEVLNNVECLLPYPSSRFLSPANTPTGWRIDFPAAGMPAQAAGRIPTAPYAALDGFSPTVQVLMHFPGGVDPAASKASRLLPDTRSYGLRSLDPDSPTVLLDADTGERVLHFIEPDARASRFERQVLFLRPGRSLRPGHRYIVAARDLVHPDGTRVMAEPPFAVLRDNRPTDIDAIASRRAHFEDIFARLARAGVERRDLMLAFDFVVQSDQGLTGQMLSMRDQAFAWLAAQTAATVQTFAVGRVIENDCADPQQRIWRRVEGTYQVPLFLASDPVASPNTPGLLNVDANGVPVQNGVTHPPFTVAIPCGALANGGTPKRPVVLGHGLFGTGRGFVADIGNMDARVDYIAGATDWWGLSSPDLSGSELFESFIGHVILSLRNFPALPDRLRQGQLNTLVLARMMKTGAFNGDPAFQTPSGVGLFAGPQEEQFYIGGSLGGIMGLMFSALSPDIINACVDVPAINFSILLQRATPYLPFQDALRLTGISDPMETALGLGIIHELWVRGESAGYATHITSQPLPGTNAKHILMASAFLDQQVTNQGTEIAARTLGLPSLVGSLQTNLPQVPDRPGPLSSALVMYDTGSFDLNNPSHAPFIPPLANLQPTPNRCDPHGLQGTIPAFLDQLFTFLQPGGQIRNFCNGRCDAAEPFELPDGADRPCDPLPD